MLIFINHYKTQEASNMPNSPLISICMPVYNAEKFLAQAIESCLQQTYPNIEIICVNDGSTDGSLAILQSFDQHITIVDGERKGAQAARNKAFAHSKGEFINFFDADNKLMPNKLALQAEFLINNQADLVFAKRAIEDQTGQINYLPPLPSPKNIDAFVYCLQFNSPGDRVAIDTDVALHRRSFVEKIAGFRDGVVRGQDKDIAFRMAAAGARFTYIDEFLTFYRDHEGPRISDIQKQGNFNINYFVSLANTIISNDCYSLSPLAKQELASKLVITAKEAYRSGFIEDACAGFKLALTIDRKGNRQERLIYKLLRSIFGYPLTERLALLFSRA